MINIKLMIFLLFINFLISLNNYNTKYVKLSITMITINITLIILSSLMQKTSLITIINITLINQSLKRYTLTLQRYYQPNKALESYIKHFINKKRHLILLLAFYQVVTFSLLILVLFLKVYFFVPFIFFSFFFFILPLISLKSAI